MRRLSTREGGEEVVHKGGGGEEVVHKGGR